MEETIKTGGKLPIDVPQNEAKNAVKNEVNENQQESLPEFEIPEYDTNDFEEMHDGQSLGNCHEKEIIMSPDELLERRQLLRKLHQYQVMFKDEVKDLPLSDAPMMTLNNLRVLAEDTEYMVATRKCSQASRTMFLSSCAIVETMTKPVGIKLNGLTNVCATDEALLSTIDELAIKYESTMMISVEQRFALLMGRLCLTIHSHNKLLEARASEEQEVISFVSQNEKQDVSNVSNISKEKKEETRQKLMEEL